MGKWKTPDDLKYARSDEWLRIEGDTGTIGISDYAQDQLNDIVYLEFSVSVGEKIAKGGKFGAVESVKAASDLYAPIGGVVTEINSALEKEPEKINADAFGSAWLIKIKIDNIAEAESLMDAAAYAAYCDSR
jgi:glycine cleavage system H protein